jgi:hypothetical protein
MKFITKISLLILLFSCIKSFGQYDQAMLDSNYRFNVSFTYIVHNFYMGNSFEFDNPFDESSKYLKIQNRYRNGISVSFRTSPKGTILFRRSHTAYSYENRDFYERGDLIRRSLTLYSLEYSHTFLRDVLINLQATGGVTYRRGNEAYFLQSYFYEIHQHGTALRDFGTFLGLSAYRDILKSRLRLRASFTHTEFFYRHDTGDKTDYEWDDGSNKRMLQFTFSIGYNFGQIPFKEK